MGYCVRCWKLKRIKRETYLIYELGKGGKYFCLTCLNQMENPTLEWLWTTMMIWLLLALFVFLSYQAGKQVGRNRP